jgi:two-component system nitrate/nitrite response regulator NarL
MRIVIAAGHRVFAEALSSLLKMAGHDNVGIVHDLDAAHKLVECEQVDACIVDLSMPEAGPHGPLREVVARAPRTAFFGLADTADAEGISSAITAGLRGVALKSDDFVEILRVLTGAASARASSRAPGSAVLSLSAQARLGSRDRVLPGPERTQSLTQREHEALVRLVRGESTTSIARSMGVRVSTARSHVDAVLTKLNAHSRAQAVARAVREGLVDVDWPTGSGQWGSGQWGSEPWDGGESCAVGD